MITRAYPLRILVHNDAVGAIIGRSGSTIKTITQQTEARIDVHRDESPEHHEKVITISGNPDNCSEACFRIVEIVQNEIDPKFDENGVIVTNRDVTLKILAASNLIGRLIGKSGSTIKKIMEQTSTRVNISTNSITDSTGEHTIVIVGKLENIRQAERLISSKLRTAYVSDMNTSLQTMSQQPYLFNNVLLPYMPSPYAQNSILASIVNQQTGHSGGGSGNGASATGPSANAMTRSMPITSNHQGQLQNSMYTTSAPGYLAMYPNANVPPTAPGFLGFNPVTSGYDRDNERETVYVHIPASMVGAIIGKSGAAIKEMISTSGASIKVATVPAPCDTQSDSSPKDVQKEVDPEQINSNPPDSSSQSGQPDTSTATATSSSPRVSRFQGGPHDPSSQSSTRKSVGRIIGKGGSTVKDLQKHTRTTIRLPDDKTTSQAQAAANTGETCVQITGDFEGSQAAQRNIRAMVREHLYARQNRPQQQSRNNESNLSKNNAQTNNHQDGDSEIQKNSGLCNADDKTTNEKCTNETVQESPSMSCNNDRQTKQQQEGKSQVNSSLSEVYDERNGADNNNTITNNLNTSSKQSVKGMIYKEQTSDVRDKDVSLANTAEWRA